MGFPEKLSASVVTSSLKSSNACLMPVDYVASLSGASPIGSDIFRGADYDVNALRRALLLLTRDAMRKLRINRVFAYKLAYTALCEVLHWQCRNCLGAGQVVSGNLKVVCPECEGHGTHRWSDEERAKVTWVKNWTKCVAKYAQVLDIAKLHYGNVVPLSKKRMG